MLLGGRSVDAARRGSHGPFCFYERPWGMFPGSFPCFTSTRVFKLVSVVLYRALSFSDAGLYRRGFSPNSVAARLYPRLRPLGAHICYGVYVLPRGVNAA